MALILAGVFIGAFFPALVGLVQFLVPDAKLPAMVYWPLGTSLEPMKRKVLMIAVPTLFVLDWITAFRIRTADCAHHYPIIRTA
jgi:ABC-type Fe3+-siderophore transport system permease subunit